MKKYTKEELLAGKFCIITRFDKDLIEKLDEFIGIKHYKDIKSFYAKYPSDYKADTTISLSGTDWDSHYEWFTNQEYTFIVLDQIIFNNDYEIY